MPFCVHKCHYCDFYSFVDTRDQQQAYTTRLVAELAALAPHSHDRSGTPVPLRTVFIGGGTPSMLRVELWEQVLNALASHFDLSLMTEASPGGIPPGEFTVECNPESTTSELLGLLVASGVNRTSIGAQSFNPRHLATLERRHNPANVARALELAKAAGIPRRSIDLIYAIPTQTLAEWQADLETALALGTTHLSCYNLTYEPNTAMTKRLAKGEFVPVDEDTEADMFELAGTMLAARGLDRYEVSNYSVPGHESLHNLAYWRQEQWLAAGPSASGHIYSIAAQRQAGMTTTWPAHRWKNEPNLGRYLDFSDAGHSPVTDHETPDAARALRERLMMGLRVRAGLDAAEIMADAAALDSQAKSAGGIAERLARRAAELRGDGVLDADQTRLRVAPSQRAWLVADYLAKQLMRCIDDVPGTR